MVGTIKRHFAEKAAASKLELLDKVPMFGVLTDAHKQLLAGALELVSGWPPQRGATHQSKLAGCCCFGLQLPHVLSSCAVVMKAAACPPGGALDPCQPVCVCQLRDSDILAYWVVSHASPIELASPLL